MPNTNTPEQSAIPKPFEEAAELAALEYKVLCKVDRDNGHRADHDFSAGAEWAYRHLMSQPIPSLRWVADLKDTIRKRADDAYKKSAEKGAYYTGESNAYSEVLRLLEEEPLLPVPQEPKNQRCSDCVHLQVDNSPDQTGPAIWCGKNHFDGIGSKEEQDDLDKKNDCSDFKRNAKRGQPSIEPGAPKPDDESLFLLADFILGEVYPEFEPDRIEQLSEQYVKTFQSRSVTK